MKRHSLILAPAMILAMIVAAPARAGSQTVDPFAWLDGEWVRETDRGVLSEVWTQVSEHTKEGIAFVGGNREKKISEYLRLERFGEEVFYTAKPHQNPFPVPFKLVKAEGSRFVFENPDHDFPQRIIYTREGQDKLLVRIEGTIDDETQAMEFRFDRK